MARRLCRLPRLFPLVSPASAAAAPKLHHLPLFAVNPSPAPLPPLLLLRVAVSRVPPALSPLLLRGRFQLQHVGRGLVGSAHSFASILSKVQDEMLPAVFYYTAVWCQPCRAIAPVISKLSGQYPSIPVYKVDIEMEGLGNKLLDLKIFSVPTFHFYHKGQKTNEVVGAYAKKLEMAMKSLHKQQ